MKNKILYIIVLILIPIFVVSIIYKTNFKQEEIKHNETITLIKNNKKEIIDLEEYIIGVVAGEMPASFHIEALKAQAVASRTYAMYKKELKTTTDDQVYITVKEMKDKWNEEFDYYYNKIKEAVYETKNLVMKKDNKVFKSYYFAMSNGQTADSITVFNETTFKSVPSPWDNESINKFKVTTNFTLKEIEQKLNINNIKNITIIKRDKTNRVEKLNINDKEIEGIKFRELLKLRSTDFDIKRNNEEVIITTRGYGHGVGMSQYGANGMAKENYTYKEILEYYYQNIQIEEI